MVRKQLELIRLRNSHPAFGGEVRVGVPGEHSIEITWTLSSQWIKLNADLSVPCATIAGSSPAGERQFMVIRDSVNSGVQL
jgi:sucrose phosphorylase